MNDEDVRCYDGLAPKPHMYEEFIQQWSPKVLPVNPCDVVQDFITFYDFKYFVIFDDLMETVEENGYIFNRETNKIDKELLITKEESHWHSFNFFPK